jgi:omega-amidase
MNEELCIAIIQYDIFWHDIQKNLSVLDQHINTISNRVDLVLLPEMFATGFTSQPERISESEHQVVLQWLKNTSSRLNATVAGSHPFRENGRYFNRFFFCLSNASILHYDKRHPFSYVGEDKIYQAGDERKVFRINDWQLFPQICYDLRFPVWSRNTDDYDVLIYSSNWPAVRNSAWEILLKARAVENQCYVIGVNRIGTDGNGIEYSGNSQVISPTGEVMRKMDNSDGVMKIILGKDQLIKLRHEFPVLKDRDNFTIHI